MQILEFFNVTKKEMIKKKIFLIFFCLVFTNIIYGQTNKKYIFFSKPYTDSFETTLYKYPLPIFDIEHQYQSIKTADISNDVKNAIIHKDYRIISVSGNSYLFPGIEGGYEVLKNGTKTFIPLAKKYKIFVKKYGFKVLKGTSDFINENEIPLQHVASDYAKKYNKLLIEEVDKILIK